MEFYPTGGGYSCLLEKVHRWAGKNGMMASFLMGSPFPMRPIRFGYIFVPSAVMPKRQVYTLDIPRGTGSPDALENSDRRLGWPLMPQGFLQTDNVAKESVRPIAFL